MRCPHPSLNIWPDDPNWNVRCPPPSNYQTSYHLGCQSSSTCISACGTPSWACFFNPLLMLILSWLSKAAILILYLPQFLLFWHWEIQSKTNSFNFWLLCNSGFCLNFNCKILVPAGIPGLHWNLVLTRTRFVSGFGSNRTECAITNSSSVDRT